MNALFILIFLVLSMGLLLASGLAFLNPITGLGSGVSVSMCAIPLVFLALYLSSSGRTNFDPSNPMKGILPNDPVPAYDRIEKLTFVGMRPENVEDAQEPVPSPCETIREDCHKNPYCTHYEEWEGLSQLETQAWTPGIPARQKYCVQKFGPFSPGSATRDRKSATASTATSPRCTFTPVYTKWPWSPGNP